MENEIITTESLLTEVQLFLKSEYGLEETEVSKMHLVLYEKLLEINGRVKRLEDHFLGPRT